MALSPLNNATSRIIETTARVERGRDGLVYEPVAGAQHSDYRDQLNYPRVHPAQKSEISSENKERALRTEEQLANASGFRSSHALRQYLQASDFSGPASSDAYQQGNYLDLYA